jgi:hypothetical protein
MSRLSEASRRVRWSGFPTGGGRGVLGIALRASVEGAVPKDLRIGRRPVVLLPPGSASLPMIVCMRHDQLPFYVNTIRLKHFHSADPSTDGCVIPKVEGLQSTRSTFKDFCCTLTLSRYRDVVGCGAIAGIFEEFLCTRTIGGFWKRLEKVGNAASRTTGVYRFSGSAMRLRKCVVACWAEHRALKWDCRYLTWTDSVLRSCARWIQNLLRDYECIGRRRNVSNGDLHMYVCMCVHYVYTCVRAYQQRNHCVYYAHELLAGQPTTHTIRTASNHR